MSLAIRNFSVIGYANGFTLWNYKAGDNIDGVTKDGFFDAVNQMVVPGDVIMVSSRTGGTIRVVVESPDSPESVVTASLS